MRIQFKSEGGIAFFPGLNKTSLIDTDNLAQEESRRIKELVDKSQFFNLQPAAPPSKGADRKKYTMSIEEGNQKHTLVLSDPVEDKHLADLINLLTNISRRR